MQKLRQVPQDLPKYILFSVAAVISIIPIRHFTDIVVIQDYAQDIGFYRFQPTQRTKYLILFGHFLPQDQKHAIT